jgi:hypothetical protein
MHLATLAGIGRAIERYLVRQLHLQDLNIDLEGAPRIGDRRLEQVVSKISAWVYAAEATVLRAARPAQRAYEARFLDNAEREREANFDSESESAQGEVAVSALIERASKDLLAVLPATGTQDRAVLKAHYRRAQVVASRSTPLQAS